MPQVYFDTETFTGDRVPSHTTQKLADMSRTACAARQDLRRAISDQSDLHRVPGFVEAAADGFRGWRLVHGAGGGLAGRPWWELRFVRG